MLESSNAAAQDSAPKAATRPGGRAMLLLLTVTFLNTVGMTMFLPILPFVVQSYLPDQRALAISVGWLASVYALCQCIAAPALGALSDRYGRRPLLLLCLAGSVIGYLLFGLGGALWVLFLGRIIDGLTGGNFSILSAYVADITAPEERGKFFGRFGAVAGAGFIVGPAIGGFVARLDTSAPALLAAAVTALSLVWGYFFLPESLPVAQRKTSLSLAEANLFTQIGSAFALPKLRWLLVATFCFSLPFAMLGSNFGVLLIDSLGWRADTISFVFLLIGITDVVMQGLLAERLLPLLGEIRLSVLGLACEIVGFVLFGSVAYVPSALLVVGGTLMFAVGTGFLEPASRGLISRSADDGQQGVVQGGSQAVQSLAMVLGPLLAGLLYTRVGHAAPSWWSVAGLVLAILAMLQAVRAQPLANA